MMDGSDYTGTDAAPLSVVPAEVSVAALTKNGQSFAEDLPATESGYPAAQAADLKQRGAVQVGDLPHAAAADAEIFTGAFKGPYHCDIATVEGGAEMTFVAGNHTRRVVIGLDKLKEWMGRRKELAEKTRCNFMGQVVYKDAHDHGALRAGCTEENAYFTKGVAGFTKLLEAHGVHVSPDTAASFFSLLAATVERAFSFVGTHPGHGHAL